MFTLGMLLSNVMSSYKIIIQEFMEAMGKTSTNPKSEPPAPESQMRPRPSPFIPDMGTTPQPRP